MSRDPVIADVAWAQSHNGYLYAMGNPLTMVDPSGYISMTASERGIAQARQEEAYYTALTQGYHSSAELTREAQETFLASQNQGINMQAVYEQNNAKAEAKNQPPPKMADPASKDKMPKAEKPKSADKNQGKNRDQSASTDKKSDVGTSKNGVRKSQGEKDPHAPVGCDQITCVDAPGRAGTLDQAARKILQRTVEVTDGDRTTAFRLPEASQQTKTEFGASIFLDRNGSAVASETRQGTLTNVPLPASDPRGPLQALVHTHPGRVGSEDFSQQDIDLANSLNVPIYVVTPSERLRVYDPRSGKIYNLGGALPDSLVGGRRPGTKPIP